VRQLSKVSGVYIAIATMFLLAILLSQCGGKSQSGTEGKYTDISPLALKSMMKAKNFYLINVHIPYAGEIPGTDMFVPYAEIGQKLDLPKDSKIVLYCRSGPMSRIAAETLVKQGYTKIYNLEKGMIDWQQNGYGLVLRSEQQKAPE
jgi:rhodanese-related sulfurtransferase